MPARSIRMATGILAIALGEATKTVPYAMDAEKTYRFTASWGESRDSDDAEGAVTGTQPDRPTREPRSRPCCPASPATLNQVPPAYSAIKVEASGPMTWPGTGETVVLEPRTVEVFEARLLRRRSGPAPSSKSVVAKALTSGPGCAIWPWRWALWAMFRPCAAPGWAAGKKMTRSRWIP